jgi:hypothetical protein
MGNNMSLGYDGEEDEQEQQEQEHVVQQEQQEQEQQEQQEQEHVVQQEQQEHLNKKNNDNIRKSNIKNKSVSESVSESIEATKIKKRKQTVRNLKALKKAGKTKSNKRILKEYQSRYLNGEREREQEQRRSSDSTLLNSD